MFLMMQAESAWVTLSVRVTGTVGVTSISVVCVERQKQTKKFYLVVGLDTMTFRRGALCLCFNKEMVTEDASRSIMGWGVESQA